MANTLCSADKTQPADATIEATWPGFLRDFKEQVLNSFFLEHTCLGKHFSGIDTDGGGTNMVVDVGGNSLLQGAPYAGLFVHVLPIATNTASGTLTVKSNAITIATGPLKLNGSNLLAGEILAGQWIQVVWDGTNWQVLNGFSLAPAILANLPSGFPTLLSSTDVDGTVFTNTIATTDLFSYSLGANSYSRILVEAEIIPINGSGTDRRIAIILKKDATTLRVWGNTEGFAMHQEGSAGILTPVRVSMAFAQTAAATIKLQAQLSFANPQVGFYLSSSKIWGIK